MTTIANMTDAAIADQAAKAAKGAESAGMKAILLAAILFRVRGFSKATEGTLYTAMAVAGVKESSAQNYVSKARAAAQDKFFPWIINVNKSLDDVRQAIQPEFTAFWGGINAIKKGGPDAKGEGRKAKDKPDEQPQQQDVPPVGDELLVTDVIPNPERVLKELAKVMEVLEADHLIKVAGIVTSNLSNMPMPAIMAMREACDAEIARRSEVEKVAA